MPDPPRAASAETAAASSSFVTVWVGDDPLKHGEVCEVLDGRKIPARTLDREDRSFNLATQPAFEVFVPADFADAARKAIKEINRADDEAAPSPNLKLPRKSQRPIMRTAERSVSIPKIPRSKSGPEKTLIPPP